jgi:hypothetical protein
VEATVTSRLVRAIALLAAMAVPLLAAARAAHAQSSIAPARTELDGLVVTATVEDAADDSDAADAAQGLEVGEPVTIRLRLEGAAAARATIESPRTLGDFEVLSVAQPARTADGALEATIVLSTLESGERTPPPLPLRWLVEGSIRRGEAALPTLAIASLVGEEFDPAEFRDIAGELAPPRAGPPWLMLAAVALLLLAAVGAILWGILRRGPAAPPEPDAWALAELARLSTEGLPARREYGPFADRLSGIVRRYASLRFAIPAEKLTTREFLRAAESHAEFPAGETERLRALLTLADFVRFAHAEPEPAECDTQLAEARRLVEATRPLPEASDGAGGARTAATATAATEAGR